MRRSLATLLLLAVLAPSTAWAQGGEKRRRDFPTIGPKDLVLDGDPVKVLLPPDGIPAISDPEFVSADEADAVYGADEPIIGLVVGGEARAYSLWHLDRHEIVNDVVGGQAIAATW